MGLIRRPLLTATALLAAQQHIPRYFAPWNLEVQVRWREFRLGATKHAITTSFLYLLCFVVLWAS